jgi:nucleoid DNA-binding protein
LLAPNFSLEKAVSSVALYLPGRVGYAGGQKREASLEKGWLMTKKEIVKEIAAEMALPQILVLEIVQRIFDIIIETLVDKGRIELRNFGVFEVRKRKARKAHNPRTGEKVWVPERLVVTFKPGLEMLERVEKLEALGAKV